MGTSPKHLMIIAGEASGDMRAAGLAIALKKLDPTLKLTGIGGHHMRLAGVDCFRDITELAVIGISEVIKNFARIKKVFDETLKNIDASYPDAVILVDYPGFNLRLAVELKKRGIKVIYYISPQVWAWREKRVKKIKTLVDRMIVLFPFEQAIYDKYQMKVDYVGHPLVDEIKIKLSKQDVLKELKLSPDIKTIGIMPGSRVKEIERHLPCMLEAARLLINKDKNYQFMLLKASSISLSLINKYLENFKDLPLKIYDGLPYDGINAMDATMVASGTATLETAMLNKPMVIIYKTSWLTYALAKALIKIPYIGLVNIVAQRKIVEELIQDEANPKNIARALKAALDDPKLVHALSSVKETLGSPGASDRAARIILDTCK